MRRLIALLGILLVAVAAFGQQFSSVPLKEHPTPADVEVIFADMSITLDNVEEPAAQLAASEWSFSNAQGIHTKIETLKTTLKEWTHILGTTGEMPVASDLYTIYTEFLEIQGDCETLASPPEGLGSDASIAMLHNATALLRNVTASNDLPTALDPAVYDAIRKLETQQGRQNCNGSRRQ